MASTEGNLQHYNGGLLLNLHPIGADQLASGASLLRVSNWRRQLGQHQLLEPGHGGVALEIVGVWPYDYSS